MLMFAQGLINEHAQMTGGEEKGGLTTKLIKTSIIIKVGQLTNLPGCIKQTPTHLKRIQMATRAF